MKKSKKSTIGTRIIAKKTTSETNSPFEYNSNTIIGDAGITGLVHLTRNFKKVKRETRDFPDEYIKIMEDRLFIFFRDFQTTIPIPVSNEKWEKNINRGLYKEIEFLKSELLAFNKKNKTSLKKSIEKAQQGDDKSIFRLVKWDKAWVIQDFMKNIIIERQAKGDKEFFKNLGDAILSLPGCMKEIRQHERLLEHIKSISINYDLEPKKTRKQLHKHLDEKGWFSGDENITPLAEYDYFTTWLKRQDII
jgi:hypothetical protein